MPFLRLLPVLMLSACASKFDIGDIVSPYRIDVQQGNLVTQDMVAQLKADMSKDQVRFLLGTPLISDIFHSDRWDYVFMLKPGRGEVQRRQITLFFENGKLARVAGDVQAAGPGELETGSPAARSRVIEIGAGREGAPADQSALPAETEGDSRAGR